MPSIASLLPITVPPVSPLAPAFAVEDAAGGAADFAQLFGSVGKPTVAAPGKALPDGSPPAAADSITVKAAVQPDRTVLPRPQADRGADHAAGGEFAYLLEADDGHAAEDAAVVTAPDAPLVAAPLTPDPIALQRLPTLLTANTDGAAVRVAIGKTVATAPARAAATIAVPTGTASPVLPPARDDAPALGSTPAAAREPRSGVPRASGSPEASANPLPAAERDAGKASPVLATTLATSGPASSLAVRLTGSLDPISPGAAPSQDVRPALPHLLPRPGPKADAAASTATTPNTGGDVPSKAPVGEDVTPSPRLDRPASAPTNPSEVPASAEPRLARRETGDAGAERPARPVLSEAVGVPGVRPSQAVPASAPAVFADTRHGVTPTEPLHAPPMTAPSPALPQPTPDPPPTPVEANSARPTNAGSPALATSQGEIPAPGASGITAPPASLQTSAAAGPLAPLPVLASAGPVALDTATLLVRRPSAPRVGAAAAIAFDVPEGAAPTTAAPLSAASALAPAASTPPLDLTVHTWPVAMIDRIARLRDEADVVSTSIRVIPDALGAIDVSLRQEGDVTHVRLSAEHAQTRALLADAQPRLADLAEQRGVKLGQTSVDAGPGSDRGSGSGLGAGGNQPSLQHSPRQPSASARARSDARPVAEDHRIA